MSHPAVSVLMNCLNGAEYLREAIDSVYAQTFTDWEIVFVDNGSTDDTPAIALGYDRRLRYIRNETTVSLGEARNIGLRAARGEFIAVLDCDDLWLPDKLEQQMPLFDDPAIGLVFSDVVYFNRSGYERPLYGKSVPPQGNVFEKMIVFDNFLCMSTVVVRGEAIRRDGVVFDPRLTALEDCDLFVRIARQWRIAYASRVLCRYRMHEKSVTFLAPERFYDEQYLMVEKYSRLFPEFAEKYAPYIRRRIERDRAVKTWKAGRGREARRLMRPIAFTAPRFALAYLAMFFPYTLVSPLRATLSGRFDYGSS